MYDVLLTITQALQLVAIAPCIFVVVFLVCTARRDGDNLLPVLYFLSLSCSFIIPLLSIFGNDGQGRRVIGTLLFGESLTVPFSFLLVMQFLIGRVPPALYWLILALPLIGGSPFIYASMFADEVCLGNSICYQTTQLRMLYSIFSTALIFLLLTYKISTSSARIAVEDIDRRHKYWLIVVLVVLNLMLTGLDLAMVAGVMKVHDVLLVSTIVRITFIYLVLTSIFRVFYYLFDIRLSHEQNTTDIKALSRWSPEQDRRWVDQIRDGLEQEHLYREMGLSRKSLADRLAISEQQASRIINTYFHKNFNELINGYRIEEAKERLRKEETAVTNIAFEVGFSSIASFNRVFRELVNQSPSEYRQTSRTGNHSS